MNLASQLRAAGIDPAQCTYLGKPILDKDAPAAQQGSPGEELLAKAIARADIPAPKREYHFDEPAAGQKPRLWRLDFAWLIGKVAVEVQGGVAAAGKGHTSRKGYRNDCEKHNAAARQGWLVLWYTTDQIKEDADGIVMDIAADLKRRQGA